MDFSRKFTHRNTFQAINRIKKINKLGALGFLAGERVVPMEQTDVGLETALPQSLGLEKLTVGSKKLIKRTNSFGWKIRSASSETLKFINLNFGSLTTPRPRKYKTPPNDAPPPEDYSNHKLTVLAQVQPYVSQKYEIFITKQQKQKGRVFVADIQTTPTPVAYRRNFNHSFIETLPARTHTLQKYRALERGLRGSLIAPVPLMFKSNLKIENQHKNKFFGLEREVRAGQLAKQTAPYLAAEGAVRKITSRERIQNRITLEIYGWKSYLPKIAEGIGDWRNKT